MNIKYAMRQLVLQRGLAMTVIALLAVGIGATSAMYSLIHQTILEPLPVPAPDELVSIKAPGLKPGVTRQSLAIREGTDPLFSYPMFLDLAAEQRVFSGLAAQYDFVGNLVYESEGIFGRGVLVSGNYFDVLQVQPALGRLLGPQDAPRVGESLVAVLSYRFWRDRLGGDPNIIGKTLTVNAQPLTIIGVAPESFKGTMRGWNPVVYVPLTLRWLMQPEVARNDQDRQSYWLYLFARLKPGISRQQAETQLNQLYRNILTNVEAPSLRNASEQDKAQYLAGRIVLEPGARGQVYTRLTASNPLTLALGITVLVLLIVCVNIANLLLTRGASRSGEMAIRASLGARRGHLVTQLLAESAVLAAIGGLLSLPVAAVILRIVSAVSPESFTSPFAERTLAESSGVALFAAGATIVTVMLFGLVPALSTGRPDPARVIRAQSRQSPGGRGIARFRSVLAACQIAMSLALLVLAGLFTQSLVNVGRIDLGMKVDQVVGANVTGTLSGRKGAELDALYDRIQDELAALPGVVSASSTAIPILSLFTLTSKAEVVGSEQALADDTVNINPMVSPSLFETLSIPLLVGRDFTDQDGTVNPNVAIVNESFLRKFGLGADAIGTTIRLTGQYVPNNPVEIIGIVADAQYASVKGPIPPQVFTPRPEANYPFSSRTYYVRSNGDPNALSAAVRAAIRNIDPTLPPGIGPLLESVESNTSTDRLMTLLSATFAVFATVLAAVGLYGVLAFNVTQRKRELGLRLALGAAPPKLRWLVMKEVGVMAAIGGAIGLAVALAAGNLAQNRLYGVSAFDPLVVPVATLVLGAVVLVASYLPARRASAVNPMEALRYE